MTFRSSRFKLQESKIEILFRTIIAVLPACGTKTKDAICLLIPNERDRSCSATTDENHRRNFSILYIGFDRPAMGGMSLN